MKFLITSVIFFILLAVFVCTFRHQSTQPTSEQIAQAQKVVVNKGYEPILTNHHHPHWITVTGRDNKTGLIYHFTFKGENLISISK
jgi:hypothetical protein